MSAPLPKEWMALVGDAFNEPYMTELKTFLQAEKAQKKTIYPPTEQTFAAFNYTKPQDVKVLLLGQDPYHQPLQAHGLSFSVAKGIRIPPSLRNIYAEMKTDLALPATPTHGDLHSWAEQGVLLLNSVLTVEASKPGSHQKKGWEQFTDRVIQAVSQESDACVFLLWGAYAQKKQPLIDGSKHLIHTSVHPSPLSAHRGFFGSKPFSKANAFLAAHGQTPVNWESPLEH